MILDKCSLQAIKQTKKMNDADCRDMPFVRKEKCSRVSRLKTGAMGKGEKQLGCGGEKNSRNWGPIQLKVLSSAKER